MIDYVLLLRKIKLSFGEIDQELINLFKGYQEKIESLEEQGIKLEENGHSILEMQSELQHFVKEVPGSIISLTNSVQKLIAESTENIEKASTEDNKADDKKKLNNE